jgi:hypothetical protein
MRTQVTFDCADPHAQAGFWAHVFGTAVEDHSALVNQLVADGRMPAGDRVVVGGRSAFRDVAACRDPAGVEPRLFFQRVPEDKIAKNRVHLDIHVDADQKAAEVERLVGGFIASRPAIRSTCRLSASARLGVSGPRVGATRYLSWRFDHPLR